MSHKYSLEQSIDVVRENKKLNANYQRVRHALSQLVEATATAQTLTDDQKKALDESIVALQYKA